MPPAPSAWGPCLFDYGEPWPDGEAELIGLEMLGPGGPLLIPQEIYDRIDTDLDLIRAHYPNLVGETHSPRWAPDHIVVQLVPGEPLDEYQALNTYFQVIDEHHLFFDFWVLTFIRNLNIPALAFEYLALNAVGSAEADGCGGGENHWRPTDQGAGVWRWDIDEGWGDCMAGCICHRLYIIDTDADGNVTLISYREAGEGCLFYCTSGATHTIDSHVSNVTLGTINNTTPECAVYADFTDISTYLVRGQMYTLSVTADDCDGGSCYTRGVAAYIDFNCDGDFVDAGEQVLTGDSLNCTDILTADFTVPATAGFLDSRLRVIVTEGGVLGPCGVYTRGETEDYTINFID